MIHVLNEINFKEWNEGIMLVFNCMYIDLTFWIEQHSLRMFSLGEKQD